MAVRIATVFGGTPDIWLRLQAKYDLQIAAQKIRTLKLTPINPVRQPTGNGAMGNASGIFIELLCLPWKTG